MLLHRGHSSGLWMGSGSSRQLDIRILDDLAPVGDVTPDSLTKFCGGATHGYGSYLVERSADLRLEKYLVNCLVELRRYFRSRSTLGCKADPIGRHQIGKACLDHSGNVSQGSNPGGGGDGKRSQLAGRNEVNNRKRGDKHVLDVAADQIGDCLGKLLVGHVGGAHARLQCKHFADQVRGGAEARGREVELPWLALEQRHQTG